MLLWKGVWLLLGLEFEVLYFTQTRIDHQGEVQRLLRFRLEDFYLLLDAFLIDLELILHQVERGASVFVEHAGKGANQILEADIVYVRDFMHPERMSSEQLKHLAVLAHHCYGSFDLAGNCLHHLCKNGAVPADAVAKYIASLSHSR